jgi:hypothetical protein
MTCNTADLSHVDLDYRTRVIASGPVRPAEGAARDSLGGSGRALSPARAAPAVLCRRRLRPLAPI